MQRDVSREENMSAPQLSRFVDFGRKIVAVGRNYRAHAEELGNPVLARPVVFMKPPSSYIEEGTPIQIPKGCKEFHHEIELGIVISKTASMISEKDAMEYVGGYVAALDLTARDFQREAKEKGLPWALAKGFDTACPVGKFIPKEKVPDPHALKLWCDVNGKPRQRGFTGDMMHTIPAVLAYVTEYFTLQRGDLVLTGSPAGVGDVLPGDIVEGGLEGLDRFQFKVEAR